MLSKKNRADKKAVDNIFKGSKVFDFPILTFRFVLFNKAENLLQKADESGYFLQKSLAPRISVIVPKTVAKLAVKRNSLRRQGYEALKKHINQFPAGLVGVLVFKKATNSILEIENEIKNILNKIN